MWKLIALVTIAVIGPVAIWGGTTLALREETGGGSGVPTSGNYPSAINLDSDPDGHDCCTNMPDNMTLQVEIEAENIAISGPPPFVAVSGGLTGNSFFATGTGPVAGFPDIDVQFEGTISGGDLNGFYAMGTDGDLPPGGGNGNPVTYQFKPKPPDDTPTPPDDKTYTIIVLKEDADTLQGLEDWEINIYAGPNCTGSPFDFGLTDEEGILVFDNLQAGTYSVEEKPQDGWNPVGDECRDVTVPGGSGTVGGLPACPIQPDLPHPDPGCDEFQSLASVRVNFTNPPLDSIECDLSGPTQITRNALISVGDRDTVPTQITAMELEGTCVPGNVSVTVRESSSEASTGLITEQQNTIDDLLEFKADSYFDVFFEVDTPLGTLHNQDPLRMECKIQAIPPSGCFYEPDIGVVTLYNDDKKVVGELVHARHIPIGPKGHLVIFQNERKDTTPTTTATGQPTATPTPTATSPTDATATKTPQQQITRHATLRCVRFDAATKVTGSATVTEKKPGQPDSVRLSISCNSNTNPVVRTTYTISAGATKNVQLNVVVSGRSNTCPFPGFPAAQGVSVSCTASPDGLELTESDEPILSDGDVDKNGTTNAIDAALTLQYSAGLLEAINSSSDVNENGVSNAIDATLILQFTAGLIDTLPLGSPAGGG